jgi:hypothetical protein
MLSSRPITVGPRSASLHHNDENGVVARNKSNNETTASKTPATSRRAFGDISNHRQQQQQQEGGLKPTSLLKPKTTTKKTFTKATPFQTKSVSKRRVELSIPIEENVPAAKPTEKTVSQTTVAPVDVANDDSWYLEDPEQSYGRTYSQQLEYDEDDDETVLSLEGVRTLREDWEAMGSQRLKISAKLQEEEIQKQLQALDDEIAEFGKTEEGTCVLGIIIVLRSQGENQPQTHDE